MLLLFGVSLLWACNADTSILTTTDIDPDGHLSRQDYLDLRHREDLAAPKVRAAAADPRDHAALVPPPLPATSIWSA